MQKNLVEKSISHLIQNSIDELSEEFPIVSQGHIPIQLEVPKDRRHGDLCTNVAFRLSGLMGQKPIEIAQKLNLLVGNHLKHSRIKNTIKRIEVKPPGYVNFWLSEKVFYNTLSDIYKTKGNFGKINIGANKKILLEFVSANPTGPLTIAHARQAAAGDSLANILEFCGYSVKREYYINDEGLQMSLLADSVRARYLELSKRESTFPENGYKGAYVYDIAKELKKQHKEKFLEEKKPWKEFFLKFSYTSIMTDIKRDLKDFNVKFDAWYSQAKLGKSGEVEKRIEFLRTRKYVYEKDGALWFKSTEFGDDKDRVIRKSDGTYTYLAPDIAYHHNKFSRGFNKLIDIWGPDHHGYVPRIKAAIQALGFQESDLAIILIQLSTLFREGKPVSMSTRQGEFVTLRELVGEVGKDAARFFFVMRKADSHLDFDLELAKKHSPQNPVYYVQYAHARICSILKKANLAYIPGAKLDILKEQEEINLIKFLWRFTHVIEACGFYLEPHGLCSYLQELAKTFHSFYDKHRVIGEDADLSKARLFLVNCTRIVLANGLKLLGVSAPKKM